jgi:hypothetical protein
MLMALLAITGTASLKTTNSDLKISSNYRTGVASLHLVNGIVVFPLIYVAALRQRLPGPPAVRGLI